MTLVEYRELDELMRGELPLAIQEVFTSVKLKTGLSIKQLVSTIASKDHLAARRFIMLALLRRFRDKPVVTIALLTKVIDPANKNQWRSILNSKKVYENFTREYPEAER